MIPILVPSLPIPNGTWLPREYHPHVVRFLINAKLLKFDNNRKLPLKSGGETDVYLNLRNVRSNPEASAYISTLYAYPLRWLNPDRFVEVPEAVSGIAGHLSTLINKPYLTIRGEIKEGRATDARVVGDSNPGEKVVIIDDVITNGASKLVSYQVCVHDKHLLPLAFVVLVDRQQGWRGDFDSHNISVPVWAGMTLHDVRRELILSGQMRRTPHEAEVANPIIIALDNMRKFEDVLPIVEPLRTTGCIFKVNDLVVNEGIRHLLPELQVYGRVMVDLKEHEIPNTVENVCRHLNRFEPWAVTVHASGGGEMISAARRMLGDRTTVLAITVLTSIDRKTSREVYHSLPKDQVLALAKVAVVNGADGLVCSPEEVKMLRSEFPHTLIVTPGVRSSGKAVGDQKRTGTPKQAYKDGANHLVMGRQLTQAQDSIAEVRRVLVEELKIPYFVNQFAHDWDND